MLILSPHIGRERFTDAMQEIEDPALFHLHPLALFLDHSNVGALPTVGPVKTGREQGKGKN